jgi:hypothetical protein
LGKWSWLFNGIVLPSSLRFMNKCGGLFIEQHSVTF